MTVLDKTRRMSFVQATNSALDEAMASDERVILLGEDIGDRQGGGLCRATFGLSTKYGEGRVRTTPISEQAIVGAAIGASLAGLLPVAEIMLMNFITVAMDQLFNHAAKLRFMTGGQSPVPITIRTGAGGGIGFAGQHSDMLEAWLAHSPGLKVVMASTPADAKGLLTSCIFDDDPCIFIEHTALYFGGVTGPRPEPDAGPIPLGLAHVVQEGSDVTIIGYGRPMLDVAAVATKLAGEGFSAEVIDLRTIQPFDEEAIFRSVAKTKRVVIVHEAVKRFGVGAEIASRINEELFGELAAPVRRVGAGYAPVPYSSALEPNHLPNQSEVERAVRTVLGS
jgi:pyruvate dehydrogenase E1 component beta subunit